MKRKTLASFQLIALLAASAAAITCSALDDPAPRSGVEIETIRQFDTQFTRQINRMIRDDTSILETTVTDNKLFKAWTLALDQSVYKTENDPATTKITREELQRLREIVNQRLDETLSRGHSDPAMVDEILKLRVEKDFIAHRILPPQASASPKEQ